MLEARNIICLLLAVSVLRTEDTYGAHQRKHRGNRIIDVNDKIIDIQCNLKCHKSIDRECTRKCSSEMIKKPRPGKCPNFRHFDTCIDLCQYDFDCSETQKCCPSSCGPLCQDPIDLDKDPTLPPIPEVISFKIAKIGKDRVCEATLQTSASSYYSYYVEIRYHVGKVLSVRKLGAWQWQDFSTLATVVDQQNQTKRQQVAFKLKPGRWYQFRVAAVSEKGLRGFTEPSKPFTLSNHPRPPKSPLDLQVISSRILNDTHMTVRVAWCPGKSDLPIEKYKVMLSQYINGSIYSNDTFIKDATQYETKIFRNYSYYIQVQAISINGKRRLKSGMESKLFNATSPSVQNGKLTCSTHKSSKEIIKNTATSSLEDHSTIPVRNFSNYEVKFRPSRKFGMIVQISGFQKGRLIEICAADYNCENTEYGAIRPKKDVIEFSKLKFGTTYTIRTNDLYGIGKRSENEVNPTSAQFTTPKCENWQKSFPRLQVDC